MAHYLLLAHQTATSPLLLQRLREITNGDAEASFTILVPETHVQHAFVCDEVETRAAARRRAAVAHSVLNTAGIRVARTEIGCADPLAAVEDELRMHPGVYDAIVLSTFAPGISRWLHTDLPSRLTAQHELPVFHVYPGGDLVWDATDPVRRTVARGNRRKPVSRPELTDRISAWPRLNRHPACHSAGAGGRPCPAVQPYVLHERGPDDRLRVNAGVRVVAQ